MKFVPFWNPYDFNKRLKTYVSMAHSVYGMFSDPERASCKNALTLKGPDQTDRPLFPLHTHRGYATPNKKTGCPNASYNEKKTHKDWKLAHRTIVVAAALVAPQHAVHQVPQRTPEVLPSRKVVLIDEQDILLEAGVEVRLEAELTDDGVMVAVDVGVDAVHALEDLADEGREGLGEGHADAAGHDGLVVDVALDPAHELLDVGRGGHLGRALVVLVVLPEILKLVGRLHLRTGLGRAKLGDGAVEQVDLVVEIHH